MITLLANLGVWNWVILGLVLLIAELLAPGIFLIWIGLGALFTALIVGLSGGQFNMDYWQVQALLFIISSIIFVLIGYYFFQSEKRSDEPLLNQRTKQLIGMVVTLKEPIIDNRGRVSIDDTIWRVTGPNTLAGTRVKLVDFQEGAFLVDIVP